MPAGRPFEVERLLWQSEALPRYNRRISFCEHCEGQRFDRARVLRALRQLRKDLRNARQGAKCDAAIAAAMDAIRALDIPHLEWEPEEDVIVH